MCVDFLVLGTAKAGTSSLHRLLSTHPQICLPEPKETWFFDGPRHALGLAAYREAHFGHCAAGAVLGEVATSYLYVPFVAERISRDLPETRLIAILRDPIERAASDWWMMHTRGWDPLPFDDAIEDNLRRLETGPDFSDPKDWADHLAAIDEGRVRYRTYVDYGFYGAQLARYRDAKAAGNLLVLQVEQMQNQGVAYLEPVFDFLGLAPPSTEALAEAFAERTNEALPSRRVGQLVRLLHRVGAAGLIPARAKHATKSWLSKRLNQTGIAPETRARLQDIYSRQADELAAYPELDFSLWPSLHTPERPSTGDRAGAAAVKD